MTGNVIDSGVTDVEMFLIQAIHLKLQFVTLSRDYRPVIIM